MKRLLHHVISAICQPWPPRKRRGLGSSRGPGWLPCAILCAAWAGAGWAQLPVLISAGNGVIAWTNVINTNALYRVEWAAAPEGPWRFTLHDLGDASFRNHLGWTNAVFSAAVPMFYRVTVISNLPPPGMVLIPGGTFRMGNAFSGEGDTDELPVHTVELSPYWIGRTEVTRADWDRVLAWALAHGYEFDNTNRLSYAEGDLPAFYRNWFDVVKWCNAKSEWEGRYPPYWHPAGMFAATYRTGQVDNVSFFSWADGYRLPTEAEWEMAARGGLIGKRFPYGDTISHLQENYASAAAYAFDIGPTRGYHPAFTNLSLSLAPVGMLAPNGYGLYDLAGNVKEWCWDRYASNYYEWSGDPAVNPAGPSGSLYPNRVLRGGRSGHDASSARVSYRMYLDPATAPLEGFRLVVSHSP